MPAPVAFDQEWLTALRASAIVQPLRPRVPIWAGESVIGSVEPALLNDKALHQMLDVLEPLLQQEYPAELGWRLLGNVTTSLNQLARALYGAGLAGEWRSEQLAVHDQFDHLKGTVERAAVRSLGIAPSAWETESQLSFQPWFASPASVLRPYSTKPSPSQSP